MFVPYSDLQNDSRVWVYQSDKLLTPSEKASIERDLIDLCNSWSAHGSPLSASFHIYDWFICLFVDESKSQASGCSIDSSVKVIREISSRFNINFFNRLNIAYKEEEETKVLPLSEFKKIISSSMLVYNNLVQTKEEFDENWVISIEKSWLSKYLIS